MPLNNQNTAEIIQNPVRIEGDVCPSYPVFSCTESANQTLTCIFRERKS